MDRKTNAWSKIHHISQKTTNSGPPEVSAVSAPFEAPAVLLLNHAKIDPISKPCLDKPYLCVRLWIWRYFLYLLVVISKLVFRCTEEIEYKNVHMVHVLYQYGIISCSFVCVFSRLRRQLFVRCVDIGRVTFCMYTT
jgi:hypothetical protein